VLAIYHDPTDAYGWLPAADYAIVVAQGPPGDGWPAVVRVEDGRVNGIAFGCGQGFERLVEGVTPDRYLLPPLRVLTAAVEAPSAPEGVRSGLIVCITTPCAGYWVEWAATSTDEDGFLVYWRETRCADARPAAVIAVAAANTTRQEELRIPFREGCDGQLGVAAFNSAGFSPVRWEPD
jgi:hypothetical protein